MMIEPFLSTRDPLSGVAGDDTTDDTAALNAFLQKCVQEHAIAYLPDRYKISGTLQCGGDTDGQARILGNVGYSRIRTTSTTANILEIGDGTNTTGEQVNGWVDGLTLYGPHTTTHSVPQNGQVALLLNKMSLFRVQNVITRYTDIGYDLRNNCYGSTFWNCKAGFGGSHNVGLNLPSTPDTGAGNQIFSFNGWYQGDIAGVHISPDGDGFAFYGGQITAATELSTRYDLRGAVILGKDYLTGNTGNVGLVSLHDVDFEGVGAWHIRAYGEAGLAVDSCLFLANGTQPAIGILKHTTNVGQSQHSFHNCGISGSFSGTVPLVLDATDGSKFLLKEDCWRIVGSDPVFNGTTLTSFPGLLATSSLEDRGLAFVRNSYMTEIILGAGRLRFNSTAFQKSTNGGTTWTTI